MAKEADTTARIMVMLDCLLDTRHGTLAIMNAEKAAAVLQDGSYHSRQCDKFEGFDENEFKKAYAARNVETLANSTLTECIRSIKDIMSQLKRQMIGMPYHDKIELVVNYYPYILDEKTIHAIRMSVARWLPAVESIEMVRISTAAMTPTFVKANYSGMFMYEYAHWIEQHKERFQKVIAPDVTLWGPAIYFKDPATAKELEEIKSLELPHPFEVTERVASVWIGLQLIDVRFFSLPDVNMASAS
jgi:hypothetical protein